ncbi:MAG TPA: hypothetical protein VGE89_02180 [Bryobacteraceae bacterium]|jgi:hypothetical protein
MKLIALTVVLALVGLRANAQSQLKVEPKELILSIDAQSAKTLCPQAGQVVTIKIATASRTWDVTINPRAHGEIDIDPAVKTFSAHIKNKGGHLGLTTGISLEVTTPDGKKFGPKDVPIPAGTLHGFLEIICTYYGQEGQEWDFKPWVN